MSSFTYLRLLVYIFHEANIPYLPNFEMSAYALSIVYDAPWKPPPMHEFTTFTYTIPRNIETHSPLRVSNI